MKYTERLTFRLDAETILKLRFLANKDNSSMGRIIRILINIAYQTGTNPHVDYPEKI